MRNKVRTIDHDYMIQNVQLTFSLPIGLHRSSKESKMYRQHLIEADTNLRIIFQINIFSSIKIAIHTGTTFRAKYVTVASRTLSRFPGNFTFTSILFSSLQVAHNFDVYDSSTISICKCFLYFIFFNKSLWENLAQFFNLKFETFINFDPFPYIISCFFPYFTGKRVDIIFS